MDKWLWAARFFKTRALAARACELGRIEAGGQVTKASREVHQGDRLRVRTESGEYEIDVLTVSAQRGPAPVARTMYQETAASQQRRAQEAEQRKAIPRFESAFDSRPSKRDRRELERLRGR